MSKLLTFADGSTMWVSDQSTPTDIVAVFGSGEAAGEAWEKFTRENLRRGSLGDVAFTGLIPTGMSGTVDGNGNATVHYTAREKTEMEILQEQVTETQEAIAELAELTAGGV